MGSRNTASKRSSSKSKKKSAPRAASRPARSPKGETASERKPFLDSEMRDDLVGIALVLFGVVVFIAVVIPGDAVLSAAIATGLRHAFGLGAFIVPFAFVIWGIAHFFKASGIDIARVVVGISLVVVAAMGLLSLFAPGVVDGDTMTLFDETVLVDGGGYAGSGLAWLFMTLLGRIIACIIIIAIGIVGLVLVGLSVSTPFLFVKNFISLGTQQRSEDAFEPGAELHESDYDEFEARDYMPAADETIQLGNRRRARPTRRTDAAATVKLEHDEDARELPEEKEAASEVQPEAAADDATVELRTPARRPRRSSTTGRDSARKAAEPSAAAGPTALEGFVLPESGMLRVSGRRASAHTGELKETAALLQKTLGEFSLPASVVGWLAGPTVTMFKVELPSGVRLARLVGLADDIALSLAAESVRIAQIPGTSLVGVEIPNKTRSSVLLGDILGSCGPGPLQVAVGEDVDGAKICADLSKMPHLLIAGTTGSGKSVCLNGMIMTMLMRATPAEVRMIMVDPKRVEFSSYNGIPHLYVPPVTEPKEAASALKWAVAEMERRLKVFEGVGARNIGVYNRLIQDGKLDDEDTGRPDEMPFIVIVIDELSDLMMVAGKDVEDSIVRIAQLARAAGIHLIVATQRPTSNVVTGMIKANITNRIALSVATAVESRVIIDQSGAEKLVGNGDMLYAKPEWGKPKRIQGCFVDDAEIASVIEHLKAQGSPDYHTEILQMQVSGSGSGASGGGSAGGSDEDPLLWDAADAVVHAGLGSTSMLQRRLKVGYARAGRIMDMLEAKGVVGPPDGSRARDVLVDSVEDLEAIKAFEAQDEEGV